MSHEVNTSTPLNLTLKRGRSVWDEPTPSSSPWRAYGLAAGTIVATLALHPRVSRARLLGLSLGMVGASLLAGRFSSSIEAGARRWRVMRGERKDQVVDRASEDSFPASDPPQYR